MLFNPEITIAVVTQSSAKIYADGKHTIVKHLLRGKGTELYVIIQEPGKAPKSVSINKNCYYNELYPRGIYVSTINGKRTVVYTDYIKPNSISTYMPLMSGMPIKGYLDETTMTFVVTRVRYHFENRISNTGGWDILDYSVLSNYVKRNTFARNSKDII